MHHSWSLQRTGLLWVQSGKLCSYLKIQKRCVFCYIEFLTIGFHFDIPSNVYIQLTAYHESGHAIVALNTDGAHPIHKATIMPRGSALGMVTQLPSNDETSISKKQLLARLDVCMGGRVAEELIFGCDYITTGASSDLQSATELAQYMVFHSSNVKPKFIFFHHSMMLCLMCPLYFTKGILMRYE